MNRFMFLLTVVIVAPAISICDEDLKKTNSPERLEQNQDQTTQTTHQLYEGSDYTNGNSIDDPIYRQLRAPSGFFGVRGKKESNPFNYWNLEV